MWLESMRTAVILAGGAGRRIGEEKAFIELGGQPLIRRSVDLLASLAGEVVVVARDGAQAQRLRAVVPEAVLVQDTVLRSGPVAGLLAGMSAARGMYAFACGCDLPFLNRDVIDALFVLAEGRDAAVPIRKGRIERLHAVYRADRMAAACARALAREERRVAAPLEELDVNYVDIDIFRDCDPEQLSFFNINTREDLRAAKRHISSTSTSGCPDPVAGRRRAAARHFRTSP